MQALSCLGLKETRPVGFLRVRIAFLKAMYLSNALYFAFGALILQTMHTKQNRNSTLSLMLQEGALLLMKFSMHEIGKFTEGKKWSKSMLVFL
jgi:hypothetical protein